MKAILSIVSIMMVSVFLVGPLVLFGCKSNNNTAGNPVLANISTVKTLNKETVTTTKASVCPNCGKECHNCKSKSEKNGKKEKKKNG